MEKSKLINVSKIDSTKNEASTEKDVKEIDNKVALLATSGITFLLSILFIRTYLFVKKEGKKYEGLNYYISQQNFFCDNIHFLYKTEIEDQVDLYNTSLNGIWFEMFLYKENDYMSNVLQKNQNFQPNATLNMLNALNDFAEKNNIKNNKSIVMIDIDGNVGWYATFLGSYRYTIITFEPDPINYYILNKNYCRNNRDIFGNSSSIIIVNEGLHTEKRHCDYYRNLKHDEYNIMRCNKKGIDIPKKFNKTYEVNVTKLSKFIPLLKDKNITLIRINTEVEGVKAIESGKELITQLHVPYVFIEFSRRSFEYQKDKQMEFLNFFTSNNYGISLIDFKNDYISVEKLMKKEFDFILLYLTYIK